MAINLALYLKEIKWKMKAEFFDNCYSKWQSNFQYKIVQPLYIKWARRGSP